MKGSAIYKARPCLIISPDDTNKYLKTVLLAPLTHTRKSFQTRVNCEFAGQDGQIALDQMRAVDKDSKLIKKVGILEGIACEQVCRTLEEMFKY